MRRKKFKAGYVYCSNDSYESPFLVRCYDCNDIYTFRGIVIKSSRKDRPVGMVHDHWDNKSFTEYCSVEDYYKKTNQEPELNVIL